MFWHFCVAFCLAFYLKFTFWHLIKHMYWHSMWQFTWHPIWYGFSHLIWHLLFHSVWHIAWHSIGHILRSWSGILSGILSDIFLPYMLICWYITVSDIPPGILLGILFDIFWHSLTFYFRYITKLQYLVCFLAYYLTYWHSIRYTFWHSKVAFHLILSDILSDICSDKFWQFSIRPNMHIYNWLLIN